MVHDVQWCCVNERQPLKSAREIEKLENCVWNKTKAFVYGSRLSNQKIDGIRQETKMGGMM